jgi:hypothetical protein
MTTHRPAPPPPRRARRAAAALALALLAAGQSACGDLLDVTNPNSVQEDDLTNPALAATLVNSALGQFECALSQYVVSAGTLAGEYINASGWLDINGWGWRGVELYTITGGCPTNRDATGLGAYTPLQQARYMAESAIARLEGYPADAVQRRDERLGLLNAYAGYAYVLFGEGFCEMAVDQGPLLTPAQVLATAEERFTRAIAHAQAANNANLRHLATLGRARARLDRGDLAGAAADAEAIPAGFVWNAEYATADPRRENRVFNLNRRNPWLSANRAAYGNLTAGGQPDPRVALTSAGRNGHDGTTPHWWQNKYAAANAPIPMASWREAQLILAEARPAEAVAAINRLRASQNIPAVTAAEGADPRALVVEERRRQLFSEGHRLGDMLRYQVAFPQGNNHKGQAYGPITCMPLPDQERLNNPNIGPRTA